MEKKKMRHKSQEYEEIRIFSEEVQRTQKKHKTEIERKISKRKEEVYAMMNSILERIIDEAGQRAEEIKIQVSEINQLINRGLLFGQPLLGIDDEVEHLPEIMYDTEPPPEKKSKVTKTMLETIPLPILSTHSESTKSIPSESAFPPTKSQKELINKLKKDHQVIVKHIQENVPPVEKLPLDDEEQITMAKTLRQFKRNISYNNIKFTRNTQAGLSVDLTKGSKDDEFVVGNNGEAIKLNKGEKKKQQSVSRRKKTKGVSAFVREEQYLDNFREKPEKVVYGWNKKKKEEDLSTFVTNRKAESLHNYLVSKIKEKNGVTIQSFHQDQNHRTEQKQTVKLPKISKTFQN